MLKLAKSLETLINTNLTTWKAKTKIHWMKHGLVCFLSPNPLQIKNKDHKIFPEKQISRAGIIHHLIQQKTT